MAADREPSSSARRPEGEAAYRLYANAPPEQKRAETVDAMASAIGAHLAEYSGGVAAWKDRDAVEKALAEVGLRAAERAGWLGWMATRDQAL